MESYAYRLETIRIAEPEFPYAGETLSDPVSVAKFSKCLTNYDQEKMLFLFLNQKNKLIGISIQTGTICQGAVYPREIVKRAIMSSATSVLMVHNHPSGVTDPSPEDRAITEQIKQACNLVGVRVLDHIILGEDDCFLSLRTAGVMT